MLDTLLSHYSILARHQLTSALTSAFFSTNSKIVALVKYVSVSHQHQCYFLESLFYICMVKIFSIRNFY